MRTSLALAAALALLSSGAAQTARAQLLQDGLTQCSQCTPVDGESLLTTATLKFLYYDVPPGPPFNGGVGIRFGGTGAVAEGFSPNSHTEWMVNPYGYFNLGWIDGVDSDGLSASFGQSVGTWLVHDGRTMFQATHITYAELLTTGQHGVFDVTSEVTSLNGFDLTGMDLHVTRITTTTGEYGIYEGKISVDVVLQIFAGPGAVPEPATFGLLVMAVLATASSRSLRRAIRPYLSR